MPVVRGVKSPVERFAGAAETFTIEGMMQNGWALQCGTSHFLGQNFGRAFDVDYQTDKKGTLDGTSSNGAGKDREIVWGASFGVSTRLIGAMIMTHSDDNGLVVPPYLAPIQYILIPLYSKKAKDSDMNEKIASVVTSLSKNMKRNSISFKVDDSDRRPGAKYYHWERRGVPVRISIGGREASSGKLEGSIRHNSEKITISMDELDDSTFPNILRNINHEMYNTAVTRLSHRSEYITSYEELKRTMSGSLETGIDIENDIENGVDVTQSPAFFLAPWACNSDNEAAIKAELKLTIRCYPLCYNPSVLTEYNIANRDNSNFIDSTAEVIDMTPLLDSFLDIPALDESTKCFYSGNPATHIALFARAY